LESLTCHLWMELLVFSTWSCQRYRYLLLIRGDLVCFAFLEFPRRSHRHTPALPLPCVIHYSVFGGPNYIRVPRAFREILLHWRRRRRNDRELRRRRRPFLPFFFSCLFPRTIHSGFPASPLLARCAKDATAAAALAVPLPFNSKTVLLLLYPLQLSLAVQ